MWSICAILNFSPHSGTQYEESFNKAIDIWQKYTCVKFVKRTDEDVYVTLTNHTS